MLTSSFRVSSSTPATLQAPTQPHYPIPQQQPILNSPYQSHSLQTSQLPPIAHSYPQGSDPSAHAYQFHLQPTRPQPPFEQFTEHMRPQLEGDNYPPSEIASRIKEEWATLSDENRHLWEQRYQEQMLEYEAQMDQWKRDQRLNPRPMNGVGGSFTTISR
jgi:HMG (high mobility group) box